ncbi:MAG: hypothetical protein AAAC48_24740 [Phyllobacterium sp.]|uniref:hypothetical protein n=1 Tax=Phyllobacterium sp. TaxID=1871046 RepID=UPI0030F17D57
MRSSSITQVVPSLDALRVQLAEFCPSTAADEIVKSLTTLPFFGLRKLALIQAEPDALFHAVPEFRSKAFAGLSAVLAVTS